MISLADCCAYAVAVREQPGQFDDDDGSADEAIRSAQTPEQLLQALRTGRVIAAIVATAEETDEITGADKSSHMSVVSMVSADGRRGLLAFTGLDALQRWDPIARPVPVSGTDAARAALDDGCEAMVIDVAGPSTRVLIEADLIELAGIDRLDYVRQLTQQAMDDKFGAGEIQVSAVHERLRVESARIGQSVIAGALEQLPRVLALVPAGIEVLADP